MYEEDYLLRIINMMGVFLRAMLAAIREHRPDDVRETAGQALTLLLGVPPTLADSLTPDGLVTMLSVADRFETKRAVLVAEVFVRRAQADAMSGLGESAATDRSRARRLIEAVVAEGDEEDVVTARALLEELDDPAASDLDTL
jgi:hypothetical protein